MTIFLNNYY